MSTQRTFLEAYVEEIAASLSNNFVDNYDVLRFGEPPHVEQDRSWKGVLRARLKKRGYVPAHSVREECLNPFRMIAPYTHRFQWLYEHLADEESRRLLIQVLAYRALGYTKVKLPLSSPEYWEHIRRIEDHMDMRDSIEVPFMDRRYSRVRLDSMGFPIGLYGGANSIYTQFGLQHYRCLLGDTAIEAEPGDYVIDGGACWGDTALYFAHKVDVDGRVYSFEFIPSNLGIFSRNLRLNPDLSQRIVLQERALWYASDLSLHYADAGPGSTVGLVGLTNSSGRTSTLTIDDLVQRDGLSHLDFIKLDIEGAELQALQGSAITLRRFRPKLAVCVYHRLRDFVDLPEYVASLDLGYRFYIRHFSIHAEETVLFAETERS